MELLPHTRKAVKWWEKDVEIQPGFEPECQSDALANWATGTLALEQRTDGIRTSVDTAQFSGWISWCRLLLCMVCAKATHPIEDQGTFCATPGINPGWISMSFLLPTNSAINTSFTRRSSGWSLHLQGGVSLYSHPYPFACVSDTGLNESLSDKLFERRLLVSNLKFCHLNPNQNPSSYVIYSYKQSHVYMYICTRARMNWSTTVDRDKSLLL